MSLTGRIPDRSLARPGLWLGALASALMVVASGCTSNVKTAAPTTVLADAPKLVAGERIRSLDFAVDASPASPQRIASDAPSRTESSPAEAVRVLMNALVARDEDTAWSIISPADRDRIAIKQHLREQTNALGWTSFQISSVDRDQVTVEVDQTPRISDVDGVIAASATLTVPTMNDNGQYSVSWSRRIVTPHFPPLTSTEDDRVRAAVAAWVRDREACQASAHEYRSGVIGVVGLGNALCNTSGDTASSGALRLGAVSDLNSLDEPDPILEGFGGAAFQWARVVNIESPIPMNVVLAPRGAEWIVIAITRPSLRQT